MFPDHCIFRGGPQECRKGHDVYELARPCNAEEIALRDKWYPSSSLRNIAIFCRVPCIAKNEVHTCPDFRLPTPEEFAEHEAKRNKFIARALEQITIVRPAIMDYVRMILAENRYLVDKIPCPVCKEGQVNFTYHGHVNGHIQAKCDTADCVEWAE